MTSDERNDQSRSEARVESWLANAYFFSMNEKKSKLLLNNHIWYQVKVSENDCGIVILQK